MISLIRVEIWRFVRNARLVFFTLGFPSCFYLLYTTIVGAGTPVGGTSWAAYFMIMMGIYGGAGAVLSLATRLATERSGGWSRLLRTTPLSAIQYIAAKVIVSILSGTAAIAFLMLLARLVNHVTLSPATWLAVLSWSTLGIVPVALLGLLLGLLLDAESVTSVQNIAWLALSMLGGLLVPIDVMPATMRALAPCLPTYRAADLVRSALGAGLKPVSQDILVLVAYTVVLGAFAIWRYRSDVHRQYA